MEIVSSEALTISYDGDAVRAGAMDVQDLAPALLAASTLLRKTNQVLNGERTSIQLKVNSDFRKGSFDVNLIVDQGLIEQAKAFLQLHPHIREAKDILDILFFYIGTPAVTLFHFIKWLRGRKPDSIEIALEGDTVKIALGDRNIIIPKNVFDLYSDPESRRAASQMVAPLKSSAIDTLQIRRGEEIETISKEEAEFFDFSDQDGELILDNTGTAWLSIIGLSFNVGHKWRFSDGSRVFTANIDDQSFWKKVHLRDETFSEGDQLFVHLRTTTYRDSDGKLSTSHVITEVAQHIRAPKQTNLGF